MKFTGLYWILPLIFYYYSWEAKKWRLVISLGFNNLRSPPNGKHNPTPKSSSALHMAMFRYLLPLHESHIYYFSAIFGRPHLSRPIVLSSKRSLRKSEQLTLSSDRSQVGCRFYKPWKLPSATVKTRSSTVTLWCPLPTVREFFLWNNLGSTF